MEEGTYISGRGNGAQFYKRKQNAHLYMIIGIETAMKTVLYYFCIKNFSITFQIFKTLIVSFLVKCSPGR